MKDKNIFDILEKNLNERILLLDGGFGTMVQSFNLDEKDFRGEAYADFPFELKGLNDILNVTNPEIVEKIHRAYLEAGADIIETNSFNSNSISLRDYGLSDEAYNISRKSAEIAAKAAEDFTRANPDRPRFVAGSVGPTNRMASMSDDIMDPGSRSVTFDELYEAYKGQMKGLIDGGADIILIETIFDTLNAKAAVFAHKQLEKELGKQIPLMISATVSDSAGRVLSGQTIEAFLASIAHANPISVGLNCGFGSRQIYPYLKNISDKAPWRVSVHANAGLPDVMGNYTETPEIFAAFMGSYMKDGLVNIIGGCCGTTPDHIRELDKNISKYPPRKVPLKDNVQELSNLESLRLDADRGFINVGERTNVAGSAKFARLIREGNYAEALTIARKQVEAGASIIDICMDDAMIDGVEAMTKFLNLIASEPEIAKVPLMIDSSKKEVLIAGLKVSQGKSIVNSISLKEGEKAFLESASQIRDYGASVVVMLFDEKGQAETFERKIEVARRSYDLLMSIGFPPEDIIFDPNIMAVGTGMKEHDAFAKAYIDATAWIKKNLPYAKVSGGVSNLSFAFRGNNVVRGAMHSAFLYHAINAGMDMAIVNPEMLQVYSSIEPELLERVEDLILCRRPDASERLSEYAENLKNEGKAKEAAEPDWRSFPLKERIEYALIKGVSENISADMEEALKEVSSPMKIIDDYLMPVMAKIGDLFGSGKMFLPQVVKSARVMKEAIGHLTPFMSKEEGKGKNGKIVIATVKGDVHDIGKNIVSVVVGCNGYEVTDLGVMTEAERIADTAESVKADAILLSGLITPSLEEMVKVCRELERRKMKVPVIIGGATTSALHTAVRIAPEYSGAVIHSSDASANSRILAEILSGRKDEYIERVRKDQENLREKYQRETELKKLEGIEKARIKGVSRNPEVVTLRPKTDEAIIAFSDFDISKVVPFINWTFFFNSWEMKGRFPHILEDKEYREEARKLYSDAQALLKEIEEKKLLKLQGVIGILPVEREGDDLIVESPEGKIKFNMLRSQLSENGFISASDYFPSTGGYICLFALSAGIGLKELSEDFRRKDDEYRALLSKLLADRLTEALAEVVHKDIRKNIWGYSPEEELPIEDLIKGRYKGVRLGVGYPALPDHTLKREIFKALGVEKLTSMKLTDNYMIDPGEAVCGIILPEGEYFRIGRIGEDQLKDYASRRGLTEEKMRTFLPNNL